MSSNGRAWTLQSQKGSPEEAMWGLRTEAEEVEGEGFHGRREGLM